MVKKMKERKPPLTYALILALLALTPAVCAAPAWQANAEALGQFIWEKAAVVICGLYYAFVAIAGGIAVVMIVHGGIKWIGGADDPGARKNAKDQIIQAVVGLVLVLSAAAIVDILIAGGGCKLT